MERLLSFSDYDKRESEFLIDGFTNGFNFKYFGPTQRQDTSHNLPLRCRDEYDLWEKVMKEVSLGRYAGPFTDIPFPKYIQSPIGLVPKAGGQTRLIFHLSYALKTSANPSVNECTLKHFCTVKYNDLDHAVMNSLHLIELLEQTTGQKLIWYSEADLKSVFHILPGRPANYWILIMKSKHPVTGKWYYFVDKCMPFGHSINCSLFQKFSNTLAHLVRFMAKSTICWDPLMNYLEDFLFLAITQALCNYVMQCFLDLCKRVGVPVAYDKTEWANTWMTFLGVLLDGEQHILAVTQDKRFRTVNLLQAFIHKCKATVKEIQSLVGLLNFLNKAIHPGRAFTRRMYAKVTETSKGLKKISPHKVGFRIQK